LEQGSNPVVLPFPIVAAYLSGHSSYSLVVPVIENKRIIKGETQRTIRRVLPIVTEIAY
jgi:hypothetical protein